MGVFASIGLVFVGLCALVVIGIFMSATPRATFVCWSAVLFFVPIWVGVSAGPFFAAITIITILAVAACGKSIRLAPADGFMAAFVLLAVVQFAMRGTSLSGTFIALTEWTLPYAWGRLVLARVEGSFIVKCLAGMTTAAAVFALIEFASGVNVFLLLPAQGPSFEVWGTLQNRGAFVRAEGAFGHSIALAATLAMGAAFVVAATWRTWHKVVALLLITGAIVVTFSRIGLVALIITVGLSVLVLPGLTRATRTAVVIAGLIGALVVVPFIGAVFLDAGQEAEGSAQYRSGLLQLLPLVQIFGATRDFTGVTLDGLYLGYYADSVDNALLVVALFMGWIPTLLLVLVLAFAMGPLLRPGRATPAIIAIVGQIPSLFTVAFITQYGMFFWFLTGLAVSMEMERTRGPAPPGVVVDMNSRGATLIGSDVRHHASDGGLAR